MAYIYTYKWRVRPEAEKIRFEVFEKNDDTLVTLTLLSIDEDVDNFTTSQEIAASALSKATQVRSVQIALRAAEALKAQNEGVVLQKMTNFEADQPSDVITLN